MPALPSKFHVVNLFREIREDVSQPRGSIMERSEPISDVAIAILVQAHIAVDVGGYLEQAIRDQTNALRS